jgi:hypothetical protein
VISFIQTHLVLKDRKNKKLAIGHSLADVLIRFYFPIQNFENIPACRLPVACLSADRADRADRFASRSSIVISPVISPTCLPAGRGNARSSGCPREAMAEKFTLRV